MIIYLFVFFVAFCLGLLADYNKKIRWIFLSGIIILISCFFGFRDIGVGTDTEIYSRQAFDMAKNAISFHSFYIYAQEIDSGYLVLNMIGRLFSPKVWIALFLTQFLIITITLLGIDKFKKYYNIPFSLYILLHCFIFLHPEMNYMRQFVALAFLLLAFYYYIEKKYLVSGVLFSIAYTMHSSALAFLVVPYLDYISKIRERKNQILLIVLLLALLVGGMYSFYSVLGLIDSYDLINDAYLDRYGRNSNYGDAANKLGARYIIELLLMYFVYWIAYKKNVFSYNSFMFVILLHTTYFMLGFLAFYVGYLHRISLYPQYIEIIFYSVILGSKKINLFYKAGIFFFVILNWYLVYIVGNSCQTLPYHSKILGI